ncbi:MAG: hypothetical protein AVDCRST_MAG89-4821 [uncultured Gemmatimonadetes bacterium]|uniref:Uncharacterized protein n=1 Tax=uncultured Gemmatimonadota bacterium TaxID=203437 RepID=A0A6J4MZU9_9BACT|nr:MAG: hypothetical protein AVDCRST_MAG89-4821 [uncultured Gemmatimonadota bacterium]
MAEGAAPLHRGVRRGEYGDAHELRNTGGAELHLNVSDPRIGAVGRRTAG